jgi:outer membrane immunogenic protein
MQKIAPASAQAMGIAAAASLLVAFVGTAFAADLPPREPTYPPPIPAPAPYYNWGGFYLGGNVGGIWRQADEVTTDTATGAIVTSGSSNIHDITAGGQVGYNYMWGPNWLTGIEVDSQWTGLSSSVTSPDGSNRHDGQFDYFGTARVRAGYVANNWLFYGTGGFAWGHGQLTRTQVTGALNAATAGTVEIVDNDRTGWAAGAGIEVAFGPNWTARAEYLHVDLGNAVSVFPLAGRQNSIDLTLDVARFGFNYIFH